MTPEQRLEVYTWSLLLIRDAQEYDPFDYYALCDALDDFGYTLFEAPCWYVMRHYPEVLRQQPAGSIGYWFPCTPSGNRKRIAVLNRAIREVKKTKR